MFTFYSDAGLSAFFPSVNTFGLVAIAENVSIDTDTIIGDGTVIGANTTIGKNVVIGANVTIAESCVIPDNTIIGPNVMLAPNTDIINAVCVGFGSQTAVGTEVTNDIAPLEVRH